MIDIRNVSFSYEGDKERPALTNIDLQVADGELVVLAGVSGCGKTTFLPCLSGLQKRTNAALTLSGKAIPIHKMLARTAMVMQDVNHQLFSDTVENELLFELIYRKSQVLIPCITGHQNPCWIAYPYKYSWAPHCLL